MAEPQPTLLRSTWHEPRYAGGRMALEEEQGRHRVRLGSPERGDEARYAGRPSGRKLRQPVAEAVAALLCSALLCTWSSNEPAMTKSDAVAPRLARHISEPTTWTVTRGLLFMPSRQRSLGREPSSACDGRRSVGRVPRANGNLTDGRRATQQPTSPARPSRRSSAAGRRDHVPVRQQRAAVFHVKHTGCQGTGGTESHRETRS